MHREIRKPLIIATPKSLLCSPNAFSELSEFTTGSFRETLDDPRYDEGGEGDRSDVRTVALCHGKVAYDLIRARDDREAPLAVVRVEQLYPFPHDQILEILAGYPEAKDVVWVQEEPRNMGAWGFVDGRLWNLLEELGEDRRLRHAARVPSASPAAGQHIVHDQELEQLLDDTFDPVAD
jgi:multifunctional 2-oxoglutarate metabolism enzyme